MLPGERDHVHQLPVLDIASVLATDPCFPAILAGERDHVHQLSMLNLATAQLLSLRLRACPGVMHPAASQVGLCDLTFVNVFVFLFSQPVQVGGIQRR